MVLKNFGADVIGLVKNYETLNTMSDKQVVSVERLVNRLNKLKDTGKISTKSIQTLYKSVESFNSDSLTYYFQSVAEGAKNARVNIVDAYAAILDGNTHGLKNVQSIMNTFNNSFDGSVEKQQEFAKAVGQSNQGLGKYLSSIEKGGTASLKGYAGQLVATTAKTIGLQLATVALQAAISVGLSLAIMGLTTVISEAVVTQKKLREAANESAEKLDNQVEAIKNLKTEYLAIIDSDKASIEKTEELNTWKQTLIDTYGDEYEALQTLNDERERGVEILDAEIQKSARAARDEWIGTNDKAIEKAVEKYYDVDSRIGSIQGKYMSTTIDIPKSVQELLNIDYQHTHGATYFNFGIDAENIEEQYDKIGQAIEILSNKKQRLGELNEYEQQLLDLLNKKYSKLDKTIEENSSIYNRYFKSVAQNKFEDYVATADGDIENVGKDTYLAWKNGLLKTAENNSKGVQDELTALIEQQFPDYEKYFDNLEKAREQFGVTAPNSADEAKKRAFLDKLSPEDLELVVTKIPDLFADGLDGATAKIEAWKADPKNKITADVEVGDADLSTMLEATSKKVKLITTAMEEMNDTGYISSSTYAEIVEMGGNFADCLEIQNGKLKLNVQKLKDLETQENLNAIAAKNLAISELQAAAAMAAQSQDAEKVEEIRKQITALEKEKAVLWQINDEIANAKPEESGSGGSSSSADPWKEKFDKQYSEKQHLLAMEQLSEEDYLDWLDGAYKEYFSDLTKYQDEYYKYEEEVYKGRKQLAEDYYNNLISDLETQIEVTTKTSESSDGTKLNTQEKFQYIKSIYQELINEVESRINDIVQAGVEGHEDALKELEKQLDEYKEKLSDVFKSAVEEEKDYIENLKDNYSDSYDERIDKIKEQQKAAEEAAQAEIDAVQEKIDALEKANEVEQEANDLIEARQNLEKASQRTRKVYGADGTVTYKNDPQKIKEAQESYNKALLNQQVRLLEDQKDALEKTKDKQSEAYDAIITNLESQKEEGERQFDILLKALDEYLNPDKSTSNVDVWSQLAKMQGAQYKNGVWIDKDGNKINLEELKKSAETKTKEEKKAETDSNNSKDNKSNTAITFEGFLSRMEKTLNLKAGSLTPENINKIFANSPSMNYNPYGAIKERSDMAGNREYVNNVNNNNNAANVTVGDININNPVGNSSDLAKELMMNLPNAFQNQMYTNLKK